MLRVVLNAWVTKTTAAEILANPATRRRQVTMTISFNPLRCTFEADGSTAELNKPLADGAGHTFSTAPSARAQKSWVRISMPRRQISRP